MKKKLHPMLLTAAVLLTSIWSGCGPTEPSLTGDRAPLPLDSPSSSAPEQATNDEPSTDSDSSTADIAVDGDTPPLVDLLPDPPPIEDTPVDDAPAEDVVASTNEPSPRTTDDPPASEFKEQATKPRKDPPPLVQGPQGMYTITFQDLELDMEAATEYDEDAMMNDRVRQLEGQKIKIKGYIHGGTTFTQRDIKQFVMVRNAECPFGGKEGVACHNIRITLEKGVDFTVKPITVEGVLKISPWEGPDGNTWSIYTLKGKVTS